MEYVFLFITLYFQIFFLVTFLDNSDVFSHSKRKEKEEKKYDFPVVSLIIPCWNEEKTVVSTVESIQKLNYPQDKIEIIMVDDGSSDSTWNEMQKLKDIKNVVLMKKDNGGKHTANNLGIEIATGDYIATIDADTILEKNALNIIIGEFLNDPELDSVGSTILVRDPKTIVQYAQMIEYQMFSFTKTLLALVHGALVVPGAFSVYKKEVFEKIGVFKDAHKLEDLEITFRMQRHGMKVGQTHHALAYTNAPDTFIKLWNQRRRWGHGFLKNSYDYKKMFFSKANHNFGFFTLPMSLFSYIAISISFVITIFILLKNIFRIIIEVNLVGWKGFENLFARLFEFSVGPAAFIYLVILSCIFFLIMFGKHIVNERSINPLPIISFFVLYSLFIPVLVIKNIYDSITTSNIKWR